MTRFSLLGRESKRLHSLAGSNTSLFEIAIWIAALSMAMAAPYWIGQSSLRIAFYGTLAASTWRLSKAMPVSLATLISLVLAIIVASMTIAIITRDF